MPDPAARPQADPARSLVVRAGGERLALPAAVVAQVLRPPRLSRVPRAFDALLGVASLGGAVLPVLSLARLRGAGLAEARAAEAAASRSARVVVLAQDPPFGLMVEAVDGFDAAAGLPRVDPEGLVSRAVRSPARRGDVRAAVPRAATAAVAATAAPARPARAVLGFTVAGQLFGLDLAAVVEIAPAPRDAASVPDAGGAMVGVAERRGGLLPLASARALLGRPAAPAAARMVVARVAGADVGLVVDAVEAILRVPDDCVEPVPALLARGGGDARVGAICRLDGGRRLLSLLSADSLFDDDTMRRVLAAAQARDGAMAAADGSDREGGAAERFVVFALGGELYALPVASVDQVVRLPGALTRVPRAPAFLEGVMNLRGAVVPVVDAARRFAAVPAPAGLRRRVLVVDAAGLKVGLIVDGVSEILSAAPGELRPAPALADDEAGTFDRVLSIARDGRLILVVSPAALLAAAERDVLAAFAASGGPDPSGAAP